MSHLKRNDKNGEFEFTGRAVFVGVMIAVLVAVISSFGSTYLNHKVNVYRVQQVEVKAERIDQELRVTTLRITAIDKTQAILHNDLGYIKTGIDDIKAQIRTYHAP